MIIVATIGTMLFVFYLYNNVKIIEVSHKPENPLPGEDITITATVENSKKCPIHIISFFAGGLGISASMEKINDKTWEYKLDDQQFSNGTEIWVVVHAISYDNSFFVSDEDTIQIGNVERSDITTLSISNIEYFPPAPTSEDTYILINASVTSNSTISKVEIGYTFFHSHGWIFGSGGSGGGGGGLMTYQNDSKYGFYIDTSRYLSNSNDARLLFRITAQDESGNTAVSSTTSLIIS